MSINTKIGYHTQCEPDNETLDVNSEPKPDEK